GDDDEAATRSQKAGRSRQGRGQLLELPVDRDPEGLERAPGGMGATRPPSGRSGDHAREPIGGLDGGPLPGPYDGARDPPRTAFLSVLVDDPGQLLLRERVHELRRGRTF